MPKSRKIIWVVFPYFAAIVFPAFLAVMVYAALLFRNYYIERTHSELVSTAVMFGRIIEEWAPELVPAEVDLICKKIGKSIPMRFTVILPSGTVIGDSHANPSSMHNHSDRPEIRSALSGVTSVKRHFSFTTGEGMMYAALPVRRGGVVVGVVRTSVYSTVYMRTLNSFFMYVGFGFLFLTAAALVLGYLVSMRIGRVFREINEAAARFSSGDFIHRLHPRHSYAETDALADALNRMADQLDARIRIITAQRNEFEAVLGSMIEAVVAVDSDERVINLNHSAESLFGVSIETARGKTIQEVILNSRIQILLKRVLEGRESVLGETVIQFETDRHLQANGSILRDSSGRTIGALIVMNDITRLKKLETVRRDFVANVSHELKTPITSIKGFVETLRDGAVNDPETARRFFDIILGHSDRLNAIIDDLLNLSRLEQETENGALHAGPVRLCDVVRNALFACESAARGKNIAVDVSCAETIMVAGNAALLEQAVVNLLDNAVKYSDTGTRVTMEAVSDGAFAALSVIDMGIGIPEKDIPRIFERFYRVDKGRSREMGGTGLGLAIVKHIVQAHRGSVEVSSAPGKGSVFTIRIPVSTPQLSGEAGVDPSTVL